ncbi:MAG TPA: hypothetical protein VNU44_21055 [Bryobacteraceae bacterium]|nr:hypothetical protein [Bryobacteraceae bacterium]
MTAFSFRRDEMERHPIPPGESVQLAEKLAASHVTILAQLCAIRKTHKDIIGR